MTLAPSVFPAKSWSIWRWWSNVTNSKKHYIYALRARNHGALEKYDSKFVEILTISCYFKY